MPQTKSMQNDKLKTKHKTTSISIPLANSNFGLNLPRDFDSRAILNAARPLGTRTSNPIGLLCTFYTSILYMYIYVRKCG